MKRKIAFAAVAALFVMPAAADAADLVTNGNFEAGNTGFTSTYKYNVDASQNPPGSYFIVSGNDHTTGTGKFLEPDPNGGTTSNYFWQEVFAVVPNSTYVFTAYVKSVYGGDSPLFDAQANGTSLFTPVTVSSGAWTPVTGMYNSGSASSVTLQMFNRNTSYSYNDLGVDDVSFVGPAPAAAVPEVASWAMMIAGFGLAGVALRRRRTVVTFATA